MTMEAAVRAAQTPGEALLLLARAIDDLGRPPRENPWKIPDIAPSYPVTHATKSVYVTENDDPAMLPDDLFTPWDQEAANQQYAEAVANLGPEPADADAARAWAARRRLLDDLRKPPTGDIASVGPKLAQVMRVGPDKYEVIIPPPSAEKRAARKALAESIGLAAEGWDPDPNNPPSQPVTDAYVKGGPLWLYYYSRAFVASLPARIIQQMILDVNDDSPADAMNMGADLLKAQDDLGHAIAAAADRAARA